MSDRMRRVNSIVHEVIADEVEILKDPRLSMVTITEVVTAPNLRNAVVYFSTIDPAEGEAAREALQAAAPRLRRALGRQVRMKYTPALEFEVDAAVVGGERIDAILRRIAGEEE
ncbi:MAG: 30S ribosome-binding factor RbfA [Acidimicrobiia bacterium]|nr:30S ribosome-binding factor RbfA [Acidimicrobiia bacterium]MDH4306820.1 30S ribosome-binding factor RbfA [Acidimicrobiia bacterium]